MRKKHIFILLALGMVVVLTTLYASSTNVSGEYISDIPAEEICDVGYVYDKKEGDCVDYKLDLTTSYVCADNTYHCPVGQELLTCPQDGSEPECTQKDEEGLLSSIDELVNQLKSLK